MKFVHGETVRTVRKKFSLQIKPEIRESLNTEIKGKLGLGANFVHQRGYVYVGIEGETHQKEDTENVVTKIDSEPSLKADTSAKSDEDNELDDNILHKQIYFIYSN